MFAIPPAARVHRVLGLCLGTESVQRNNHQRHLLLPRLGSGRNRLAKRLRTRAKGPCPDQQLQVVFVATEVAPWSKVGGLGDVIASLPCQLASRGHAVMTVTPRYQAYADAHDTGLQVPLQLPGNKVDEQSAAAPESKTKSTPAQQQRQASALQAWACLYHCHQNGVDRVFVDHPLFLQQHGVYDVNNVNTYLQGPQFPELDLRYSVLCQAALAAPILLWHQPAEHLYRLQLQANCLHSPRTISGGLAQCISLAKSPSVWQGSKSSNRRLSTHAAVIRSAISQSLSDVQNSNGRNTPPSTQASSQQSKVQLSQDTSASQLRFPDVIWPSTAGQIAFVANDWPCFPLTQRLAQLQFLSTEQCAQQLPSAVTGAEDVSSSVSAAANSFEAHMARLLKSARVAFCIHNLAYQGIFPQESFSRLCFSAATVNNAHWPISEGQQPREVNSQIMAAQDANPAALRGEPAASSSGKGNQDGGCIVQQHAEGSSINWLKGAMARSHKLLTVSPSYADQIVQDPAAGFGLHNFLSTKHVRGILNGIDTEGWNPMKDKHIPPDMRYSHSNVTAGKAAVKAMFQKQHGLDGNDAVPLIAAIGRLAPQKGFDIVLAALPKLLASPEPAVNRGDADSSDMQQTDGVGGAAKHPGCQLVMLGSGDAWMESALDHISKVFHGRACGLPYFSEKAAHQLIAAADFLLLPSRFEPCGLVAMHGLRYGAVPITSSVGGFDDIVKPEVGYAMGCMGEYGNPAHLRRDAEVLVTAVQQAVAAFGSQEYLALQQTGMTQDMSWQVPAQEWEQALQELLGAGNFAVDA